MDRCEAKGREWAKHWQCVEEVQKVEEKLWMNEELRKLEEALPRLKECHFGRGVQIVQAKTGMGCDSFHRKFPWS